MQVIQVMKVMQAIAIKPLKFILKLLRTFWDRSRRSPLNTRVCSQISGQITGQIKLLAAILAIAFCLGACSNSSSEISSTKANLSAVNVAQSSKISSKITISEVSPPPTIQKLSRYFDAYEPQIEILEPKSDRILTDTKVAVKFAVKDLPIFKNPDLGLGTHVHVILDNQEYKALYDLSQPLVFENLAVGTHTIRAFVSRPWHESFKNEGAFAQTTFHVYTKTGENTPNPQLPLLTYSRPVGVYGAEPIMLDFYLKNTPLHAALLEADPTNDWQIRVTVNNQSFNVDQWQPIYIKGLNTGLNWVKLEFLDSAGHLVPNQFNSTAHLINYQPNGTDTLSRLIRGEAIAGIEGIVNPNYTATQIPAQVTESNPAVIQDILDLKSEPKEPKSNELTPEIPIKSGVEDQKPQSIPQPPQVSPPISKPKSASTPETLPEIIPRDSPIVPIQDPKIDPKTVPQISPSTPDRAVTNQTANELAVPIIKSVELPKSEPKFETVPPLESTEVPVISPPSKPFQPEIDLTPEKVLKGLDNLNLGERLKQSRQKKAVEQNTTLNIKENINQNADKTLNIDPTESKVD